MNPYEQCPNDTDTVESLALEIEELKGGFAAAAAGSRNGSGTHIAQLGLAHFHIAHRTTAFRVGQPR